MRAVLLRNRLALGALVGCAFGAACESPTSDRILAVASVGYVRALIFHDNDLDVAFGPGDQRLRGVTVDLMMRGASRLTPGGATDSLGYRGFTVPTGRWTVRVAAAALGDSMEVSGGETEFTVADRDTITVVVALRYKGVDIAAARALPNNARRWVRGIALNEQFAFADSTIHITGDSLAIRVVSVRPNYPIIAADSVMFLSRRSLRDGQPVLVAGTTLLDLKIPASFVPVPPPDSLSTLRASTADSTRRDARLAKVAGTTISDTTTITGNKVLTVSDGSGALRVFLSPNINFGTRTNYRPGVKVDVVGVLVPDATAAGKWVLKPRRTSDLAIIP